MLELSAKLRPEAGQKNKFYRKQGLIPAVLYGHKIKNLLLLVKLADFKKILKETGETVLLKLKIADLAKEKDKGERVVLIHGIARDPVSDEFIHADFYQVKMDQSIKTKVPLVFVGQSFIVDKEGGVLIKNIHEVEVEALPLDLPHEIEADISVLKNFEDQIRIKDLKIPPRIKITAGPEEIVVLVAHPRTEAELEALEKAPAEIGEVEVIGKEKKEEEAVLPEQAKTEQAKEESAPDQSEAGGK